MQFNNPFSNNNNNNNGGFDFQGNGFGAEIRQEDHSFGKTPDLLFNPDSFENGRAPNVGSGSPAILSTRVISCNFIEMVEQATMGFRPFMSNVTNSDVLDRLPTFIEENRLGRFNSQTFNSIASDLVQLSASTTGNIPIVNGWATRRYSVVIMAEVMLSVNGRQVYMIEGFTDTPEISENFGRIMVNPEMTIYVNNVTSFGNRQSESTGLLTMVPISTYNVIDEKPLDTSNPIVNDLVVQRPYDIAGIAMSGALVGIESKQVFDATKSIKVNPKPSRLENNNPATYVAKIINNGVTSLDSTSSSSIHSLSAVAKMMDFVAEPSITENNFLRALGRANGSHSTSVTSFTWKELTRLDNSLERPDCPYLNLMPATHRSMTLPPNGFACDDPTGSGQEQLYAASIANCVSDLLAKTSANMVSVVASNHSGEDKAFVNAMKCYNENDTPQNAKLFEVLFERNVIQLLNYHTNYAYNISVQATVWGDTIVKINLGYGTHTHMYPNFANSLYSPVLANNKSNTALISSHMLTVTNRFNQHLSETASTFNAPINQSVI